MKEIESVFTEWRNFHSKKLVALNRSETLEIVTQYLKPAVVGIYTEEGILERWYDMWMRLADIVKYYVCKSEALFWPKQFFFQNIDNKRMQKKVPFNNLFQIIKVLTMESEIT